MLMHWRNVKCRNKRQALFKIAHEKPLKIVFPTDYTQKSYSFKPKSAVVLTTEYYIYIR